MVRYYGRLGLYVGTMMTVAACSAFIAVGLSLVGRRFDTNYVVARTFHALVGKTLGLQVELEGEEILDTRPAVLMLNHQSMLDVLVIGRQARSSFRTTSADLHVVYSIHISPSFAI